MRREGDPADLRLIVIFLRSLRHWNQAELAEAARVDKGLISDYEQGKVAPSRRTLERIARAVGVTYAVVERLLPVFQAVRLALEEGTQPAGGSTGGTADALTARLARAAGEAVLAQVTPALLEIPVFAGSQRRERSLSPAEARREAAELWETVKGLSPKDLQTVVTVAPVYHTWTFCEHLCEESARAAADQAKGALELAGLALRVAERVAGSERSRARLQSYAWAFVGNARRVQGDLPGADTAFLRSARLWREGEPTDPEPLDGTRLLDLEASLRRHQGRFAQALALHDRALAAHPRGLHRGRLLLKKAFTLEQQGAWALAVETLKEAADNWIRPESRGK